jgi:enoyl-CoA hydratase/carnithine racemase
MLAHVEGGIGWMTYNNPARHNAMSYDMQLAVPRILSAFSADPEVHVVVVQGAGDRAFVSGADISEFSEKRTTVAARADYDDALAAAWASWRTVPKPIIAMIRGYCIGGGLLTAMQADIRIAAADSQFGVPAAKLGLGYAYGGVEQLMDLVGPAWAAEILFSARRLSAEEAHDIGLVNRVVPVDDLEPTVRDLAATIAANAPLTVQACKAAIREARKDPAQRDLAAVERMVEACFRSDDYLEGQAAFAEKRAPVFKGM